MTVAWHYSRDRKKHGPVSSPELQALARKGLLSPEDLVWKEGMQKWEKAGSLKGLFPVAPAAPPPEPPKETSGAGANGKHGASSLGDYAKVAGELVVKQAEKTKIQTLSLPQAYASLGKAVYGQGAQHADTTALFAAISDLCQQLAAVQSGKPCSADNATLGQRAVNVGKQASALVSAQQLESKLYQQYSRLGELTTQRADLPNHDKAANKGIRELQERVRELGQQISALKEKVGAPGEQMQQIAKATAKRVYSLLLTAATIVTFPIAPLSWLPIWKHPRWGTFRKVTLAIMSLACTIGLVTFVIVKKGAVDKAVASANAEWDKENQEEAIRQYRSLLPNSGFLGKEQQARVYRRLIEFDVGHDNKESAGLLIEKADDRSLELNLTEPRATAMLAEYQHEKREKEAKDLRAVTGNGFSRAKMSDLYQKAKTLRIGMPERDALLLLGKATRVLHTDPGALMSAKSINTVREVGGSLDLTPYDIFSWSASEDPDNCFVMVAIKGGHVVSAHCNEGKGKITFHLDIH